MQKREIAEPILAAEYEWYLELKDSEPETIPDFLARHDAHIPVWAEMDAATKQAAMAYVYKNRDTIELHSGCCPAWVQATAYFMLWDWFYTFPYGSFEYGARSDGDELEIDMFFDDLDFVSATNTSNAKVREMLGIQAEFHEPF